jgi:hypothetical protein
MSEDMLAVVARLEKVERQNRRLKMLGLAALMVAIVSLLLPPVIRTICQAANIHPVLAVRGVAIYDKDGDQRGFFGFAESEYDKTEKGGFPILTLLHANGTNGASLSASAAGTSLDLADPELSWSASLAITTEGPSLHMSEIGNRSHVILSSRENSVLLGVFETGEKKRKARLLLSNDDPSLTLMGRKGETLWSAP